VKYKIIMFTIFLLIVSTFSVRGNPFWGDSSRKNIDKLAEKEKELTMKQALATWTTVSNAIVSANFSKSQEAALLKAFSSLVITPTTASVHSKKKVKDKLR